MALKIGQRVMIKENVSRRQDAGSTHGQFVKSELDLGRLARDLGIPKTKLDEAIKAQKGPMLVHPDFLGQSRKDLAGKRGTIIEIGEDGRYLVDDQVKDIGPNGEHVRVGTCTMREWVKEDEVEVG